MHVVHANAATHWQLGISMTQTSNSIKQAVVLCGGKASRLGGIAQSVPKCLLPIGDLPLLELSVRVLQSAGISRVVLAAGHLGEEVREYCAERTDRDVEFTTALEESPLGTAGAVRSVSDQLDEHFLVVYGDIYLDANFKPLLERHMFTGSLATLLVRSSDHPWDSHLVLADDNGIVSGFSKPGHHPQLFRNTANCAVFVCSKELLLRYVAPDARADFFDDVMPRVIEDGGLVTTYRLPEDEFVRDMGTPDRLDRVRRYHDWRQKNHAARVCNRPVSTLFLDRDGTLIQGDTPVRSPSEVKFLPGVLEAMARFHEAGVQCHIITNQPWIARGLLTLDELEDVHDHIRKVIVANGGDVAGFRFCPHHPETHHGDGITELRRACECRKPQSGMIRAVIEESRIELPNCVMIGDSWRDIAVADRCGIRSIQVGKDRSSSPCATIWSPNLLAAVDTVVEWTKHSI